jgi:hypothetical protein
MHLPRTLSLVALLAVAHLPSRAWAQGVPDPSEPDRIRAAYAARRDPAILLDLAASLRRVGRNAEAATVYDEYRRNPAADPARVAEVQRALADIDASYVGRLQISFDDPAASVWLDGRPLPAFTSGGVVRVDPGDHQVTAARGAMPPISTTVRVGARESRTVELRMGTYIPPTAPLPPPVIVVAPPPAAPQPGPTHSDGTRTAGTVLVVVGALGVGAGAIAGFTALGLDAESRAHCLGGGKACDQAGVDYQQQSRASGVACTVGLGAGGALLLTGAILRAVSGRHSTGSWKPFHVLQVGERGAPEVVW